MYAQDKGMIHISGGMEPVGTKFHDTTQNGVQFKAYECFISGIFHLVFSEHN